jgi:PLD-like domain
MGSKIARKGKFTLRAYVGDAKTLLAFNYPTRDDAKNLAGFTIQVKPGSGEPYYLHNMLRFKTPADHAQDPLEPPNSTINAPIHKFRWVHVPGVVHQGLTPYYGKYRYTVTPRFFDEQRSLEPADPKLAATVQVDVRPFKKGRLAVGFTRGFVQSQAFVNHFGRKALISPKKRDLLFDTAQQSGQNAAGQAYTYQDEYEWLGFTARARIFEILDEVAAKKSLRLDVFAYDFNEPDIAAALLKLAPGRRVRVILDNAALHHNTKKPKLEDEFETQFRAAAKDADAQIRRGKFGRYAHDKIFVVRNKNGALRVLTGSTNFSVTGIYVNSNHVLVYNDRAVASKYAELFDEAWKDKVAAKAFRAAAIATQPARFASATVPATEISFAPHAKQFAEQTLDALVARVQKEGEKTDGKGSVLFACMDLASGSGPVYPALRALHAQQNIFSYGISDSPGGIHLYAPRNRNGVLVTGKPTATKLPPPFNQVPGVGLGHQVHHKFVVCAFNGSDPTVYCGSSNLALGGETANGDNLLCIRDGDVAIAFAIEALALVDHFDFLDHYAAKTGDKAAAHGAAPPASKQNAAEQAEWFLGVTDRWVNPYYDDDDLHSVDRRLFA